MRHSHGRELARDVFTEQGLDVSTDEIARRAGVGVATLFRCLPTRDDLIGAVFADNMCAYTASIEDALADPDPWRVLGLHQTDLPSCRGRRRMDPQPACR